MRATRPFEQWYMVMAMRAGMATMIIKSPIMPMVSISTTLPTKSRSVRGMTKGASSVSSSTTERHSVVLPPPRDTHMRDATPVGMAYSSTRPVVNRGASGKRREPAARVKRGMAMCSRPKMTTTGRGWSTTSFISLKPPPRLLAKVMKANSTMV